MIKASCPINHDPLGIFYKTQPGKTVSDIQDIKRSIPQPPLKINSKRGKAAETLSFWTLRSLRENSEIVLGLPAAKCYYYNSYGIGAFFDEGGCRNRV